MRIAYWTGYSPVFAPHTVVTEDWELPGGGWGSERSLAQMAVELVKRGHHVEIFCWRARPLPTMNALDFDVVIVQRYLNYWLYEECKQVPTVYWQHDVRPLTGYENTVIYEDGKQTYANLVEGGLCSKTVTLTPSHTYGMMQHYNIPHHHFNEIGHGLDAPKVDTSGIEKVKNRMVWISGWNRGLCSALEVINRIDPEKHGKISFHIYGHQAQFEDDENAPYPGRTFRFFDWRNPSLRELVENSPHDIELFGYVSDEEIEKAWAECDILLYPTDFVETYCICALEAQRAGCFIIASDLGSMPHTIGDRGVLVPKRGAEGVDMEHNDYIRVVAQTLETYMDNPELTIPYREAGKAWADEQTLENKADEWVALLESVIKTNQEKKSRD